MAEVDLDENPEMFSMASYEYCVQALRGRIFPHGIRLIKRAIVGSKSGSNKAFLKRFSPNLLRMSAFPTHHAVYLKIGEVADDMDQSMKRSLSFSPLVFLHGT